MRAQYAREMPDFASSPRAFLERLEGAERRSEHAQRLCFAHRGGAQLWPENTLEAFAGALDLGVSHIESDVHRTRDGHLVLFHDARVERTTNGSGYIRDFTLSELKQLDAGYRFYQGGRYPFRAMGHTIPTLEEALERFPGVRLNLELKQREPDIVRPMWDLIERRGLHDQLLIAASFDPLVQEFREVSRGRVATSAGTRESLRFLIAARLGLWRWEEPAYDALQLPVKVGVVPVVTRRLVDVAHRLGIQVHVWTIDSSDEMRALWRLGVDGIMSDRPDLLVDSVRGS